MIHFELIFVKGIRFVSRFFFLCVDIQFSAPCVKKTVFPLLYFFFLLCQESILSVYSDLFLGSLILFH